MARCEGKVHWHKIDLPDQSSVSRRTEHGETITHDSEATYVCSRERAKGLSSLLRICTPGFRRSMHCNLPKILQVATFW